MWRYVYKLWGHYGGNFSHHAKRCNIVHQNRLIHNVDNPVDILCITFNFSTVNYFRGGVREWLKRLAWKACAHRRGIKNYGGIMGENERQFLDLLFFCDPPTDRITRLHCANNSHSDARNFVLEVWR